MQQPEKNPFSLFLFKTVLSIIFAVISVGLALLVSGSISPTAYFLIGFISSVALSKYFSSQIEMSYWWLVVYWELVLKNKIQK